MRLLLPACIALLAAALPAPAHGQPSRASIAPPDTALARVLTAAALEAATPPRAHLTPRPGPFPWRITVPDTLAPTWRLLARTLAQALEARPLAPADTVHAFVSFDDVVVAGDALRASLAVGLAWRCPNGAWMRSTTGYAVKARRVRGAWQPPRVDAEMYADPAPCERLAPPR